VSRARGPDRSSRPPPRRGPSTATRRRRGGPRPRSRARPAARAGLRSRAARPTGLCAQHRDGLVQHHARNVGRGHRRRERSRRRPEPGETLGLGSARRASGSLQCRLPEIDGSTQGAYRGGCLGAGRPVTGPTKDRFGRCQARRCPAAAQPCVAPCRRTNRRRGLSWTSPFVSRVIILVRRRGP
jgi:hypothetical protein